MKKHYVILLALFMASSVSAEEITSRDAVVSSSVTLHDVNKTLLQEHYEIKFIVDQYEESVRDCRSAFANRRVAENGNYLLIRCLAGADQQLVAEISAR